MERGVLVQRSMGPRLIIVGSVDADDPAQVRFTEHDDVVQALPAPRQPDEQQTIGVVEGRSLWRPAPEYGECSSCVISARQLHMPRRFDGHRLPPGADAYRRLNRRECRTAIARCGNVPFGTPYYTNEQKRTKRSGGSDQSKAIARWDNEGGAPKGLRKKIAMNWHPSLTKRRERSSHKNPARTF
jgi:hypothetical protein